MYIGVDYYPEHWQPKRWPRDAKLMRQAGFNVVRLAEFAWTKFEPTEGQFDFAWLDDALAILRKNGIAAILSTPTAIPPAWAARKYPEIMQLKQDGTRTVWGVRKHCCLTSGAFRLLSERITRALAEHYRKTPQVIGWQTDNELWYQPCYCNTCRTDWYDWLRTKYRTLAELNRAWGTHFWSQQFGDWAAITIPMNDNDYNPSAGLDWRRYASWQNVRFQRDQVRILRQVCPRHFITHNCMGLYAEINYYDLAADLDFVSWDNYPVWGKPTINYDAAAAADVMRGLKRKNFWIMEQTAGPGGWGTFGRNPRPGEIRMISYQQLAHGADGQIWFRWRTCTAGREQYWHGLLGHDGEPLRRYREARQVASEYHKLARYLDGTTVKADVAIIYDYECHWATKLQASFNHNDYQNALRRYHRALFRAGINVDMVPPTADFTGYKIVFAPQLYLLPDALAKRLNDFVAAGGVLVTDCRTGVKDETSLCHERTLPGLLTRALGIRIEEYEAIADDDNYPLTGQGDFAGDWTAIQYADWLTAKTATPLLTYTTPHMKKFAAATRHTFGKGTAFYVGAIIKEDRFYDLLIKATLKQARVRAIITPPEGVEVSVRQGRGRKLIFVINHNEQPVTVTVPAGKRDLLTGRTTTTSLKLPGFGVAVLA